MKKIIPKKLNKGDTIGLLSISGALDNNHYNSLVQVNKYLNQLGYQTIISDTSFKSQNYLAGTDKEKITELENFFLDDKISAIINTRGGYGVLRILNKIDYNIIKNNPKIFVGYSDITALLLMIYKKTGLITFHGAMACPDLSFNRNEFTTNSLFKALQLQEQIISPFLPNNLIPNNCTKKNIKGCLWGGNLATINSLIGLDFIPDENLILFLEDINEPVYKIDKMLTQLFNLVKIKNNVKAIILGEFFNLDNKNWFEYFISEFSEFHNIPILQNYKISHGSEKITLPIGLNVELNLENGNFSIYY